MDDARRVALVASLRAEYERADRLAADVQTFRAEASIPANNELRYAGKHLLDATTDEGAVDDEASLVSAVNHCRRASYEAVEAGILHALLQVGAFKKDYALIEVTPSLPDWSSILAAASDAQDALEAGRASGPERTDDYDALSAQFALLKPLCRKLQGARDDLNKRLSAAEERKREEAEREEDALRKDAVESRRWFYGFVIAAVTAIAAVASAVTAAIVAQ